MLLDYNDSQERIIQEQEKIIRELNTRMMEQEVPYQYGFGSRLLGSCARIKREYEEYEYRISNSEKR